MIHNQEIINIQSERNTFFISDGLISASPSWDLLSYYFSGKDISRKKTASVKNYKNYNHNFAFMGCRL